MRELIFPAGWTLDQVKYNLKKRGLKWKSYVSSYYDGTISDEASPHDKDLLSIICAHYRYVFSFK